MVTLRGARDLTRGTYWDKDKKEFVPLGNGEYVENGRLPEALLLCTLCGEPIEPGVDPGDGFIGREVACGRCIRKLVSPDAHLGAVEN